MTTTDTTTEMAAPEQAEDAPEQVTEEAVPSRWRVLAGRWWSRLRAVYARPPEIVHTRQPPIAEIIAYSRTGEWTASSGAGRAAHVAYTYAVAVPIAAVAYWLRWLAERPARLTTTAVAAVLIGTGLARIPGPGWIVPPFLDMTTWF